MPKVVIMRGIPGSGKSTYIRDNLAGAYVASADHYFMRDGKYEFDMKKIGLAHGYCKKTFTDALAAKRGLIVVDNTNVKVRDFSSYVSEAKAQGYEVEIVRIECDPAVAASRGLHHVPMEATLRMAQSLAASTLPNDWPSEKVIKTAA